MDEQEIVNNKPFGVLMVIATAFAIAVAISLMGCYGEKKAVRQSVKAYSAYPGSVARLHSGWFPIKDSISEKLIYKPGEVRWRYDTVTVDCDSVWPTISSNGGSTEPKDKSSSKRRVPCPPCPFSVDTLEHYKYQAQESTAAVQAKDDEIGQKDEQIKSQGEKIAEQRTALNVAIWSLVALGAYTIIRWVLRRWLKITLP